jgi:hypothetical protein
MAPDNFYFYFQNSLIQTGQTGDQWYNDTSHIIPWLVRRTFVFGQKSPRQGLLGAEAIFAAELHFL